MKDKENEVKCFIVMPISTADPSLYGNDQDHFRHVLEFLFMPALKKAGITAISPLAEGSDLIHAEIIHNIEHADLVLCDMSSLNPNVFFELGIRTATNKPVCIVKDEITPRVPFDTTIVNYHTYLSTLSPWILERQIDDLCSHIQKSVERSKGQNAMWQYFGLSTKAILPADKSDVEQRLDILALQLDGLVQRIDDQREPHRARQIKQNPGDLLFDKVARIAAAQGVTINAGEWKGNEMKVFLFGSLANVSPELLAQIHALANASNFQIEIRERNAS